MDADWKSEYDELRQQFRGEDFRAFQGGHWFAKFARAVLFSYEKRVDADYIRRRYPGLQSEEKARKAIELAARHCGYIGCASATVVTAAALSTIPSLGSTLPVAVPAVATAIMADVAGTARVLLRSSYDLSVIQDAPLSAEDYEDCLFIFTIAMGAASYESATAVGSKVGPRIVAFNLRRLLRAGLRSVLVNAAKKLGGTQLARRLTERAIMRVAVPGISVPVSGFLNREFAYAFLQKANVVLRKRGAVVRPVIRMFRDQPDAERSLPIRTIIAMVESATTQWSRDQVALLRHCQTVLNLSDAEIRDVEERYDRTVESLVKSGTALSPVTARAIVDIASVAAAVWPDDENDGAYAGALDKLAKTVGVLEWKPIAEVRRDLNREPRRTMAHEFVRACGSRAAAVARVVFRGARKRTAD